MLAVGLTRDGEKVNRKHIEDRVLRLFNDERKSPTHKAVTKPVGFV